MKSLILPIFGFAMVSFVGYSATDVSRMLEGVDNGMKLELTGSIVSDWDTYREEWLMELLRTTDKTKVLRVVKAFRLDELSNANMRDFAAAMNSGCRSSDIPRIYLFYKIACMFRDKKIMPASIGNATSHYVTAWDNIQARAVSGAKPKTKLEIKLLEQEAWDYIKSL